MDPAGVYVDEKVLDGFAFRRARIVRLPKHDPPLFGWIDATGADIIRLTYHWPGTSYGYVKAPEGTRAVVTSAAEAQRIALPAVRECFGGVPAGFALVRSEVMDHQAYIEYHLLWQKVTNGVRLPDRLEVSLDAAKGRVAEVSHVARSVSVSLRAKISRDDALHRAIRAARKSRSVAVSPGEALWAREPPVLEAGYGMGPGNGDRQYLRWRVELLAAWSGSLPVALVNVDARSGKIIEVLSGVWPPGPPPRPSR